MATGSAEMNVDVKGCNGTSESTSTSTIVEMKTLPVNFFKEPILLRRETFYEPEPYKVGTSLAYSYVEPSKSFMEVEPPSKKPRIEGKVCSFDCIMCLAQALNLEETKPNLYEKK
jgi:hypothetical protein